MTPHRLHLLGVPHTRTTPEFSHCAFTQKVLKFIPMMRAQGCEVWHYGVGDENPGADKHIQVMTDRQQKLLLGHDHSDLTKFYGDDANIGNGCYNTFNHNLAPVLKDNVGPSDFVCLPFGHAHAPAVQHHAGTNVETGIGYPVTFEKYRIFESYAWLHRLGGVGHREGTDYEWVIPNYFVAEDWPVYTGERKYLAFFGRICEVKGLSIVKAIAAARPDLDVVICGQGDPGPWLRPDAAGLSTPNLRYCPPLTGTARAKFLGQAIALLAPSRYIEPFCGVTVEANLCGTPALTSHFGAFTETVTPFFNGQRCRTLGDWLAGIEWAEKLGRSTHEMIAADAENRYSLEAIGPRYKAVFDELTDLKSGKGWYTQRSVIGTTTKAMLTPVRSELPVQTVADMTTLSSSSTKTPVTVARWDAAQVYERAYWLGGDAARIAAVNRHERGQHVFYRGLIRISPDNCNGKRVLDIGCGPFSIGLDADLDLAHLTAVDPAHYAEVDENVYLQRKNVHRVYSPVEELPLSQQAVGSIDEVWCYNLLQHVIDPTVCIGVAAQWAVKHGATFRIFEWCNVPPNDGHPHVLTAEWLRATLRAEGFEMRKEMSGLETASGYHATEFYAAVWERA